MKPFLILFVCLLSLPFLALGAIIAVLRLVFTLTIGFAWVIGDEWYGRMSGWTDRSVKTLKTIHQNQQKQP